MKDSVHPLVLLLSLFFLFSACIKDKKSMTGHENMWQCHHLKTWNLSKTKSALMGEWQWENLSCNSKPGTTNHEVFNGLRIDFRFDNTLHVIENGQITQISTWTLEDGDADLFKLDVTPRVNQLYGRILLCEGRVQFNDSYRDGCDNQFTRIK